MKRHCCRSPPSGAQHAFDFAAISVATVARRPKPLPACAACVVRPAPVARHASQFVVPGLSPGRRRRPLIRYA